MSSLAEEAGKGLLKSLGSSAVTFVAGMALEALFPSDETKTLKEIQAQLERIEKQIAEGFDQVYARFDTLENKLKAWHQEEIEAIKGVGTDLAMEDIDWWYSELRKGLRTKNEEKLKDVANAEGDVRRALFSLYNGMCIGNASYRGLLDLRIERLVGQLASNPDLTQLLEDYVTLEVWFENVLRYILRGVTIVEYSYFHQNKAAKEYRYDFLRDPLKPMLDKFLFSVEALVLGYISCAAQVEKVPYPGSWHDVMGVVHIIFRRCDVFVLGFALAFRGRNLPPNLLCGRVIGPDRVLELGEQRYSGLKELTKPPRIVPLVPFEPIERVTHPAMSWVDFQPNVNLQPDPDFEGNWERTLSPHNVSELKILRYRLTGFADDVVASHDDDVARALASPGSPVAQLRGTPAIDDLGYPAVWDREFFAEEEETPDKSASPQPESRYRAETVFALPLLPAFHSGGGQATPQPDEEQPEVLFNLTSRFDAAWQAQLFYPSRRCNRHSPGPLLLEPQSRPIHIALQADTGKYVGRAGNTGVDASKTGVEWASQFVSEGLGPGAIGLRADTGKYLGPTGDFRALDLSAASASPLVCIPCENDRIALYVFSPIAPRKPSPSDLGAYISRKGATGIGLATPAGQSAHVQDPCSQFMVHYLHPFWSDKNCMETPREVSFYVDTSDGCSRGHQVDTGYAKLFRYDGDRAKLRIRALIDWHVWFYAFDTDAHLHIDVLRTKADRRWDATWDQSSSKELTETVPLVSVDWAHMPSRGPGGWGDFHKGPTNENEALEVLLDVVPGESVWLRAEASLWWPEYSWLSAHSPKGGGESHMQGRIYHRIKDIEFSWER